MILLVDCNNFFVSCEQLFNPALKNKPVCVLSNNDGCIVARSNEAKELGVSMGLPYFIARKKFKNVIYLSGNIAKYSQISKRVMAKLGEFTPSIETYSIDEAFLDMSGCEKMHKLPLIKIAEKIRNEIKDEIGIEVSIGAAKTKTLAKIASEIAKNNTRYHIKTENEGAFEINDNNLNKILEKTPIENVWGVGKNLHKFFRKHNVINAKMYAGLDEDFLKRNLGKRGLELKSELLGVPAYRVEYETAPPKSISKSCSFKEFTTDKNFIKNELNKHLHRVCIKLRKFGLSTGVMSVMLRRKDFIVSVEKTVFAEPKNSEFELYNEMHSLFEKLYKEGVIYRSAGVCVTKLEGNKDVQMLLFESDVSKRKRKLSQTWDRIEQKFGYGALQVGMKPKEKE